MKMEECIFCKIIQKQIPSDIVYEDEKVVAFKDIQPAAPIHILIVPKQHIENVGEINEQNANCLIDIHMAAKKIAEKMGILDQGFRLINNCGRGAGQTVMHLHYHLLGGKTLGAKIL